VRQEVEHPPESSGVIPNQIAALAQLGGVEGAPPQLALHQLRLALEHRGWRAQVVRRDGQQFVLQPFDVAARGDVAEDDDAASQLSSGVVHRGTAEGEYALAVAMHFDFDVTPRLATLECIENRTERLGERSRTERPLAPLLA